MKIFWRVALCADDLALVNEWLENFKGKLEAWKGALESKELRGNVKKTKMIISCEKARKDWKEGKFPFTVCWKTVGGLCYYRKVVFIVLG